MPRKFSEKVTVFSTNCAETIGYSHVEKKKNLYLYLTPLSLSLSLWTSISHHTQKLIQNESQTYARAKTIKHLEKIVKVKPHDHVLGNALYALSNN